MPVFPVITVSITGKRTIKQRIITSAICLGKHTGADLYLNASCLTAGMPVLKILNIRSLSRNRLTRLRSDRPVNPDGRGNIPVSSADISEAGTCVHLKDYGFIRVFKIVVRDGDIEYRATDDLETDEPRRLQLAGYSRMIGEYHRGLKQFCGAERSQVRLAVRAFLRFGVFSLKTGYSRSEAETRIIRDAVKKYLTNPIYVLCPTA